MPTAGGPNTLGESNLVFAYDTGDVSNSYIGQPGTNITTGINRNYDGYNITTYSPGVFFETNGYSETVNIPALGTVTAQSVEINNSASGFQCCPNLFNYTGGFNSIIWTPGQTYTYQIIFKTRSGYTHPNFMYHYQYTSGESYITEYGLLDTNKMESLGDGWYHAWNTFTVGGTAVKGYTGLWYYNYNVADKVSIATIAITPGSTVRPPKQIIPSGTTRSVTQGLLPLIGNSTIDLTNVSFDSSAKMVFDGTNDYIAAGNPTDYRMGVSNFTLECVMKQSKTTGHCLLETRGNSLVGYLWVHNYYSTGQSCLFLNYGGNQYLYFQDGGFVATTTTQYYHMAIVVNRAGNTISFYVNGNKAGNDVAIHSNSISPTGGDRYWVGADLGGSPWQGEIPIFRHYNRTLSGQEIRQNYQQYKTRFNLS